MRRRLRGSSGGWIWCSQRLGVERLAFCLLPFAGAWFAVQCRVRAWVNLARVQAARADQFSLAWFVVRLGFGACPACAGSYRFWSFVGLAEGRGRVSARRPTFFLLLRQKKEGKEKATPLGVSLRFAAGSLRCSRVRRCRRTHCAPLALRSNNCGKSEHEAWACCAAPARLTRCASRHVQRGVEAQRGPSLRSAWVHGRAGRLPDT